MPRIPLFYHTPERRSDKGAARMDPRTFDPIYQANLTMASGAETMAEAAAKLIPAPKEEPEEKYKSGGGSGGGKSDEDSSQNEAMLQGMLENAGAWKGREEEEPERIEPGPLPDYEPDDNYPRPHYPDDEDIGPSQPLPFYPHPDDGDIEAQPLPDYGEPKGSAGRFVRHHDGSIRWEKIPEHTLLRDHFDSRLQVQEQEADFVQRSTQANTLLDQWAEQLGQSDHKPENLKQDWRNFYQRNTGKHGSASRVNPESQARWEQWNQQFLRESDLMVDAIDRSRRIQKIVSTYEDQQNASLSKGDFDDWASSVHAQYKAEALSKSDYQQRLATGARFFELRDLDQKISDNPHRALDYLKDSKNYPALTPEDREDKITEAQLRYAKNKIGELGNLVRQSIEGVATSPEKLAELSQKGIITAELQSQLSPGQRRKAELNPGAQEPLHKQLYQQLLALDPRKSTYDDQANILLGVAQLSGHYQKGLYELFNEKQNPKSPLNGPAARHGYKKIIIELEDGTVPFPVPDTGPAPEGVGGGDPGIKEVVKPFIEGDEGSAPSGILKEVTKPNDGLHTQVFENLETFTDYIMKNPNASRRQVDEFISENLDRKEIEVPHPDTIDPNAPKVDPKDAEMPAPGVSGPKAPTPGVEDIEVPASEEGSKGAQAPEGEKPTPGTEDMPEITPAEDTVIEPLYSKIQFEIGKQEHRVYIYDKDGKIIDDLPYTGPQPPPTTINPPLDQSISQEDLNKLRENENTRHIFENEKETSPSNEKTPDEPPRQASANNNPKTPIDNNDGKLFDERAVGSGVLKPTGTIADNPFRNSDWLDCGPAAIRTIITQITGKDPGLDNIQNQIDTAQEPGIYGTFAGTRHGENYDNYMGTMTGVLNSNGVPSEAKDNIVTPEKSPSVQGVLNNVVEAKGPCVIGVIEDGDDANHVVAAQHVDGNIVINNLDPTGEANPITVSKEEFLSGTIKKGDYTYLIRPELPVILPTTNDKVPAFTPRYSPPRRR